MKQRIWAIFLAVVLVTAGMGLVEEAQARRRSCNENPSIRVIGAERQSADVQSILESVDDLLQASNNHDLEGILKHYSPTFISGDNLRLDEIRKLIEETWDIYPDIRYENQVLEVRVNGDWATVESLDHAYATVSDKDGIIAVPGELNSRSRGMIYLRRMGKTWEIVGDYTIYENATILYGEAKDLEFTLSAPDQVFADESYTARIDAAVEPGTVVIASISKDPLIYPQPRPRDKFRSMSARSSELERVFEANSAHYNEIVTATIGLTEIGQDMEDRPTVRFKGIATVVKRVNVMPKVNKNNGAFDSDVVKHSVGGEIDLRKKPTADDDDE